MDSEDLQFFNPYAEIRQTENRLPHWQQYGAVYFVTFRLADSVPAHLRDAWEEEREIWLRFHPKPWDADSAREYHERFSGAVERWLDAGHGACVLKEPACAEIVAGALRHFDGSRCGHLAWVVMPNHFHLLFVQRPEWPLEKLLHSWKRFTARRINESLGKTGPLWQRDYFDRLIRDRKHFANCVRYLRRNPQRANLHEGEYLLYESALAKLIE